MCMYLVHTCTTIHTKYNVLQVPENIHTPPTEAFLNWAPPLWKFHFSVILLFKKLGFWPPPPSPLEFLLTFLGWAWIFSGTTQCMSSKDKKSASSARERFAGGHLEYWSKNIDWEKYDQVLFVAYSDVKFIVGPNRKVIRANKAILMARLDWLYYYFVLLINLYYF